MKEIQNDYVKISFQTDLIYHNLHSLRPLFKTHFSSYHFMEFDDAFNELYIQVHKSIHNLKCIHCFNNWVLKIFILHSKKIKFSIPLYDYIHEEIYSTDVLQQIYLDDYFHTLKNIEKQIITDNVIYDKPLIEIAKKHNLSYENIRIMKYRALKRIKQSIKSTS